MLMLMRKLFSFEKIAHLKRKRDWEEIKRSGKKKHLPHFLIIYRQNEIGETRLGISVSKKVGGAVIRNRIKRAVREVFRLHRPELFKAKSVDCVVIVKQELREVPRSQWRGIVETELVEAWKDI